MKKFVLAIICVLCILHINSYLYIIALDNDHDTNVYSSIEHYVKGDYIVELLTKRCTKDDRIGKERRSYFQCGKVRIKISDMLFGEYVVKNKGN